MPHDHQVRQCPAVLVEIGSVPPQNRISAERLRQVEVSLGRVRCEGTREAASYNHRFIRRH